MRFVVVKLMLPRDGAECYTLPQLRARKTCPSFRKKKKGNKTHSLVYIIITLDCCLQNNSKIFVSSDILFLFLFYLFPESNRIAQPVWVFHSNHAINSQYTY